MNYIEEIKKCFLELKDKDKFYIQIPNLLTLSRVFLAIPIDILIFKGNLLWGVILSSGLFITDFFDGRLARKFNCESEFGALLDALCDKVMVLLLVIPMIESSKVLVVNFLLELGISLVNVKSKLEGNNPHSSIMGKIKTWGLFITLGLSLCNMMVSVSSLVQIFGIVTSLLQVVALGGYIDNYRKDKNLKKIQELAKQDITLKGNINDRRNEVKREYGYRVIKKEEYFDALGDVKGKRKIRKIDNN